MTVQYPSYPFGDYVEPRGPEHQVAGPSQLAPPTSNRFNVVEFLALPGKCAVCGYSGGDDDRQGTYRRRFVDFGFDVDFYGVVGFCEACVVEMASALGFISKNLWEGYRTENSDLKTQIQELKNANSQLRGTIGILSHGVITDVDLPPYNDSDITSGNSETTESEQQSSESIDEPRSDDVSSITSRDSGSDGLTI